MGCDMNVAGVENVKLTISIHAARMGCDNCEAGDINTAMTISIHAARMGCDLKIKSNVT